MARILDFFRTKNKRRLSASPDRHIDLFNGLKDADNRAISVLYTSAAEPIYQAGKLYHLPDEDIEELIGDCIALMLLKIKTGEYVFQGFDPATFCIEIAKNKVKHFHRRHLKNQTADIEPLEARAEEPEVTSLAEVARLENLLSRLNPNCQQLIRLKYLDEIPDKEVVAQQLTLYDNVDTLKNQRARCMKKLREISHGR